MHYIEKIHHHAQTRPDINAISQKLDDTWRHVTWRQLWQQVELTARQLQADGVAQGDRIAIFADNSIEWTIVDFACIYLGAVSVPVYATSSPNQLQYILDHSGAKVLFVDAKLINTFVEAKPKLSQTINAISFGSTEHNLPSFEHWQQSGSVRVKALSIYKPNKEDLLTIIYTSGTTGDPKGVMLNHGNLMAVIKVHLESLDYSDTDRSLAVLPLSHVYERGWTFVTLYLGVHNHYLANVNELQASLLDVKPHVFCAVPRIFEKIHAGIFAKAKKAGVVNLAILNWASFRVLRNQRLLQQGKKLGVYRKASQAIAVKLVGKKIQQALGGNIRFMPSGGASLDPEIHGFFLGLGVNIKLGYGMTETFATVSFIPDTGYKLNTVGKPIQDISIKIDPKEGEILVRSPCMTSGYYKNPEATAELFQDGWLKTGDAGSIDEQGNLVFRERLKELMKTSGGKYIAPQQIEGVLIREPLFEQVAVIADSRKFVSALIVPAWQLLEEYAQSINITYTDRVELLRHSSIIEHVKQRLELVQHELAKYERVKNFTLLVREFSITEGEITPTLKLRRKVISARFSESIDKMYGL
ncbi:AMP-dependent synthetase/ligase [Reinekea sp.]|uniref:AMP-dependent synthetase/ligase n=1 Tax=Reinekea sp. TaxID=1970455 RepID=UPI0039893EEC